MRIPFTNEQFLNVFEKYNAVIYPFQVIIIVLGIFALLLIHTNFKLKNIVIGIFLGLLWFWMGIVYHITFFSAINNLAFIFGIVFILQGLLIFTAIFQNNKLEFNFSNSIKNYFGYIFIVFGIIIYPVLSYFIQGSFPRTISLGLPCPTTIFTFGFFLMTTINFPKYLLIIPTLWSIIGISAALQFGVFQDLMMPITAIITNIILFKKKIK